MRASIRWVSFLLLAVFASTGAAAAEKDSFKLAWSIYVGWMPWDYAERSGILKKWADKYGISIRLVQVDAYLDSITQYTLGGFDGCAMTNMDALAGPAASGADSTALIIGDTSHGNDGVVLKGNGRRLADIKGQQVRLVQLSVSHYLLARALDSAGLQESDVRLVDTPDAEIVQLFSSAPGGAVVAWKPQLTQISALPNTTLVFDSSRVPGEIIDMMVVKTDVLRANPRLGRALVGAWYETLGVMMRADAAGAEAVASMARASNTDIAGFRAQLATTRMFYRPAEAVRLIASPDLIRTMDRVRTFSFRHRLLGRNARSIDSIGIEFPGGKILGDRANVRMRFDASFTQLAADGRL